MKRRKFLSLGIPATGAIMLAPGLLGASARAEINRQFSGSPDLEAYDLLINGGGFGGYFAALAAVRSGKRVLLVERRSALGYELTAKSKLYLGKEGASNFSPELKQLFTPEGERQEVHHTKVGVDGLLGEELTLMAGSLKKGLLRNLLINKVDTLLMTDVCGLFSDDGKISGALIATKQGTYAIKCANFLDASELNLFSRNLAGSQPALTSATFTLEIWNANNPVKKDIPLPAEIGVKANKAQLHPGKHAAHQVFLEFSFDCNGLSIDETENKARLITDKIGQSLHSLDQTLDKSTIQQMAWECSYTAAEPKTVATKLKSHHLLRHQPISTASDVLLVKKNAESLVKSIPSTQKPSEFRQLDLVGKTLTKSDFSFSEVDEPGLSIPLQRCSIDWNALLPKKMSYQVVVAGAGTSGSMVALGALEKGAKTIVFDYYNELGGTKTVGGVMGYYHGYQKQKFFKQQDAEANQHSTASNMTKKMGRMQYLRAQILGRNGEFLGRAILCGAINEGLALKGTLVCHNSELKVIKGDVHIDATGDGDLAEFAGASFDIGDNRANKTQNYSQWDIRGAGPIPTNTNRDYDILNTTRVAELQRGIFLSHYEAHFYDFHPMLAVRESRRVKGVYELDVLDAVEGTHFKDALILASSDFDPHYTGMTEFTRCGFLLPHSNDVTLEVPYRCIVPEKIDGLLISGRGFSQTHNALQFTRMTADLIVLGYLTGQISADLAWKGIRARDYDVSDLQKEWQALGYYPDGFFQQKPGNSLNEPDEITKRINGLAAGKREYLYEVIKLSQSVALPRLKTSFERTSGEAKLLIAKAIAWFGDSIGSELIAAETEKLHEEERAQGYPRDFVDNYDLIRGREKNQLEGHFWRVNQNIGLLAMSGNPAHHAVIAKILGNTTSGGPMMKRENDYFDGRIDLKLVPFHNRILNLAFYVERLPDRQFIEPFEKLLKDEYIGGFVTNDPEKTRWKVYGGDLELFIAAALARSGGQKGYELLTDYLGDIHYDFKAFASKELKELTGKDLGYDQEKWKKHVAGLNFPKQPVKFGKTLEV
jgi:hypothetical protein